MASLIQIQMKLIGIGCVTIMAQVEQGELPLSNFSNSSNVL